MIVIQPNPGLLLINAWTSGPNAQTPIFGPLFDVYGFASFRNYLLVINQLIMQSNGTNLQMQFLDSTGAASVPVGLSYSSFAAGVETVVAQAVTPNQQQLSSGSDTASTCAGQLVMNLGAVQDVTNAGFQAAFSGQISIPVTNPVNTVMPGKFAGSANSVAANRRITTLRFSINGGAFFSFTSAALYGLRN